MGLAQRVSALENGLHLGHYGLPTDSLRRPYHPWAGMLRRGRSPRQPREMLEEMLSAA
jgi:hypothetical protein